MGCANFDSGSGAYNCIVYKISVSQSLPSEGVSILCTHLYTLVIDCRYSRFISRWIYDW